MKTKGWGPWRYNWFSLCSAHGMGEQKNCKACNSGIWQNHWKWKMGSVVFFISPKLWRWWMNRDGISLRDRIKNLILNTILNETEKVLIVESLDDRLHSAKTSMSDSSYELSDDIRDLKSRFKTTTPGNTWYNIEK